MLDLRDLVFIAGLNIASIVSAVFIFRIRLENRITKLETLLNVIAQKLRIGLIED